MFLSLVCKLCYLYYVIMYNVPFSHTYIVNTYTVYIHFFSLLLFSAYILCTVTCHVTRLSMYTMALYCDVHVSIKPFDVDIFYAFSLCCLFFSNSTTVQYFSLSSRLGLKANHLREPQVKRGHTGTHHFEAAGDVAAEHARLQGLHVAAHVGLRVQDVSVVRHLVEHLLLLVGEHDVGVEGLHHQQGLAEGARTLTQHLQGPGATNHRMNNRGTTQGLCN